MISIGDFDLHVIYRNQYNIPEKCLSILSMTKITISVLLILQKSRRHRSTGPLYRWPPGLRISFKYPRRRLW